MTQRILVELLLFLIPFAVFLVYRAASRDLKIKDRWPLTRLVTIGAVFMFVPCASWMRWVSRLARRTAAPSAL